MATAPKGEKRCKVCFRRALWQVQKEYGDQFYCNSHFEAWAIKTDFDPDQVERLSDEIRDFEKINRRPQLELVVATL